MGWSCAVDAAYTMDRLTAACVAQTGIQNVYTDNGNRYMWERSDVEHADGRITGSVWRLLPDGRVMRSGRFSIGENGEMHEGPAWLKRAAKVWMAP